MGEAEAETCFICWLWSGAEKRALWPFIVWIAVSVLAIVDFQILFMVFRAVWFASQVYLLVLAVTPPIRNRPHERRVASS